MVFKRRDRRPWWQSALDFIYPRGGWSRAFSYVKHRVRRLPDTPEKIARGIFAGVFTCFTPLFGMHFLIAAILARLMNGNLLASLLATFFGNPVTFPFIGAISLKLGHWMLGTQLDVTLHRTLVDVFVNASREIKDNFIAMFTSADADWSNLHDFYSDVFLPYLVGGIVPGVLAGLIGYYLSVPVITVYQNRRRGRLKAKLAELRKKRIKKAEDKR